VEQAQAMIHKLEEAGVKPGVIILPQTGHDVFARRQQFADQIKDFFAKTLENKNQ
jgi:tryptophanase